MDRRGWISHALIIIGYIIAIFPYAGSLYQDIKSGYVKIIFTKVSKKKYFVSKIIAAFLSGGTAVVIPLILNLFLTALFVPALRPDASTMMFSINDGSMFSDIYYSKPFVYILLKIIFACIFGKLYIHLNSFSESTSRQQAFQCPKKLFFPLREHFRIPRRHTGKEHKRS